MQIAARLSFLVQQACQQLSYMACAKSHQGTSSHALSQPLCLVYLKHGMQESVYVDDHRPGADISSQHADPSRAAEPMDVGMHCMSSSLPHAEATGPASSVTCSDHPPFDRPHDSAEYSGVRPSLQSAGIDVPLPTASTQHTDEPIPDSAIPLHSQHASPHSGALKGWQHAHRPYFYPHAMSQPGPDDQQPGWTPARQRPSQNPAHQCSGQSATHQSSGQMPADQSQGHIPLQIPVRPVEPVPPSAMTPSSREDRLRLEAGVDITYKGSPVTWFAYARKHHLEARDRRQSVCMWCRDTIRVGDKIWRHCICGRSGVSGYCCQQQPWQHAYCALVNRGSPPWLADVTSAAGTNACAGTSALAGVNVSAGDNSQQACTHTGTEEGLHGKARWTGVVASQSPAESRERTQLPQSSLQVSQHFAPSQDMAPQQVTPEQLQAVSGQLQAAPGQPQMALGWLQAVPGQPEMLQPHTQAMSQSRSYTQPASHSQTVSQSQSLPHTASQLQSVLQPQSVSQPHAAAKPRLASAAQSSLQSPPHAGTQPLYASPVASTQQSPQQSPQHLPQQSPQQSAQQSPHQSQTASGQQGSGGIGSQSGLVEDKGRSIQAKRQEALKRLQASKQRRSLSKELQPHSQTESRSHAQPLPLSVPAPSGTQSNSQTQSQSRTYPQSFSTPASDPRSSSGSYLGSDPGSSAQMQTPSPQLQTPPRHPPQVQSDPPHWSSPSSSLPTSQSAVPQSQLQSPQQSQHLLQSHSQPHLQLMSPPQSHLQPQTVIQSHSQLPSQLPPRLPLLAQPQSQLVIPPGSQTQSQPCSQSQSHSHPQSQVLSQPHLQIQFPSRHQMPQSQYGLPFRSQLHQPPQLSDSPAQLHAQLPAQLPSQLPSSARSAGQPSQWPRQSFAQSTAQPPAQSATQPAARSPAVQQQQRLSQGTGVWSKEGEERSQRVEGRKRSFDTMTAGQGSSSGLVDDKGRSIQAKKEAAQKRLREPLARRGMSQGPC